MAAYKTSLQEDLRKRICQFRNSHLEKPKIFIVKHFLDEGASKATIYRALERVDNNLGYQSKKGSGPKAKKMDKKHIDQLKKAFDHHHHGIYRPKGLQNQCFLKWPGNQQTSIHRMSPQAVNTLH